MSVLSNVKIKNKRTGAEVTYTLVSEEEADLKQFRISVGSPIGKGLLGKKVGETAEITVPAAVGIRYDIRPLTISHLDECWRAISAGPIHPVQDEAVQVNVEVGR